MTPAESTYVVQISQVGHKQGIPPTTRKERRYKEETDPSIQIPYQKVPHNSALCTRHL